MSERRDTFEAAWTGDPENILEITHILGALNVAVTQEKAMDSYNQVFTCVVSLNPTQARALRDWLNGVLP